MKCEECGAIIADGDEKTHTGRTLCEDCYLDLLSPAKACDPWAVFCAKQAEKNQQGQQPLTPIQEEILALLRKEGPMEPAALSSRLQVEAPDIERELATLRHMEKISGELRNGIRLIRLWEAPSPDIIQQFQNPKEEADIRRVLEDDTNQNHKASLL